MGPRSTASPGFGGLVNGAVGRAGLTLEKL